MSGGRKWDSLGPRWELPNLYGFGRGGNEKGGLETSVKGVIVKGTE